MGRGSSRTGVAALLVALCALGCGDPSARVEATRVDDVEHVALGAHVGLLLDPDARLGPAEVGGFSAARFSVSPSDAVDLGFRDGAAWLRIELVNRSAAPIERLLLFDYEQLDEVRLFEPASGGAWRERVAGDAVPHHAWPVAHRSPTFDVLVPRGSTVYLVQAQSTSPLTLAPHALSRPAFEARQLREHGLLLAFYGLLLGLLIYNLFLLLSLREPAYLFYALYLAAFGGLTVAHSGHGFSYFWPESGDWNGQAIPVFVGLSAVFTILFARELLGTKARLPKADRVLLALCAIALVGTVLSELHRNAAFKLSAAVVVGGAQLLLLAIGWIVWRRGYQPARFYIAAQLALFLGVGVSLLQVATILPAHFFSVHAFQLAGAAEALLLSMALADRIHGMRRDLEEARTSLGKLVQERTVTLRATSQELEATSDRLADERDERRRIEEQLRHSQKMEAIGQMAGGIAHDMNNVLATIRTYAMLLAEELPEEGEARADLDALTEATRRGAALTTNLLGFARRGKLAVEPVSIHRLLQEVQAILERTTTMRIQVRTVFNSGSDVVLGDPNQLSHAVMNLCLNAVKAIDANGTITLRTTRSDEVPEGWATEVDPSPAGFLLIEVIDDGCGMDDDTREHAFEPFFTHGSDGGTGLGLSMVYGCVRHHAGAMRLESRPGVGTTVGILLPLTEAVREAPTPEPPEREETRPLRVLIVDDEAPLRRGVRRLLVKLGHDVTEATCGEEAIARYSAPGAFDIVLLDLVMPGLDGAATFAAIRELDPDAKVLVVSGYSEHGASELLENGALGYLQKPFALATLADALTALSARSS